MYLQYYLMGIILLPGLIFAIYAQSKVTSTFNKFSKVYSQSGETAGQLVKRLLVSSDLSNITVKSISGNLTDHYNPTTEEICLSENVYSSNSLSALGVACHEFGHALQKRDGYIPYQIRKVLIPITNFASTLLWPLVFIGLIFNLGANSNTLVGNIFLWSGIIIFGLAVLFNLATLPVEYDASNRAIKYQMDPRNILNNENIFQFAELKYTEGAQTIEGIMSLTEDSFLEGESISKALIQAGKNVNVDPYFITSRLIQEQGRKGTVLSKGYEYNGTIVYNPFNVNATGNSKEEIIENAAEYAYNQGWDSLEKALIDGVHFVRISYIDIGQNTLYLQKFDVVNVDENLYTHQYMQNLLAPKSEASNMKAIYEESNTVDANLNFIIPLYENMPEEISEY